MTLSDNLLHPAGNSAQISSIGNVGVVATDTDGDLTTGTVNLTVKDDVPTAVNDAASVVQQGQDFNVAFVLDFSGSIDNTELNQMLNAVRAAGQSLFNSTSGDVSIQLVAFSSTAISYGPFTSYDAFSSQLTAINGSSRPLNGGTDFTAAIQATIANYVPVADSVNQIYFISDGNPTEQTGTDGQPLIAATATAWNTFVNNPSIDIGVQTIGIGNGINTGPLQALEVDGGAPILIANFTDLIGTLLHAATPSSVSGNVLLGTDNTVGGGDDDAFGADGGFIKSIAANGTTYTWNGVTGASSVITLTGATTGTITGATSISVTVALGGHLDFYFAAGSGHLAGDYNYTTPSNVAVATSETFNYVIQDGDGDLAPSSLVITVTPAPQPPAVSALAVAESGITFTITDPESSAFTLAHSPVAFATAFGNPALVLGSNTINPTEQPTALSGTLQVTDGTGTANVVGLYLGTIGSNSFTAGSLSTAIYGFDGADTLTGGSAPDWIFGGAGNDTIVGAQNDFLLDGGANTDTLQIGANFTSTSNAQIVNIENVTLTAAGTTLNLSNQTEGFAITTSSGGSTITAGTGADTVIINAGTSTTAWTVNLGSDSAADKIVFNHASLGLRDDTVATVSNFNVANDHIAVTLNGASITDGSFQTVTSTETNISAGVEVVELVNSSLVTATITDDGNNGAIEKVIQLATNNIPTGTYTFIVYSSTNVSTANAGIYTVNITDSTNPNQGHMTVEHIMTLNGVGYGNLTSANFVATADPLVLDLGHAGIDFSSIGDGVSFDINADGVLDQVAWTSGEDGFLAYDLDGSGRIESGRELFTPGFAGGHYADGLAALASLDSNHDGVIDAQDAAFANLVVWQDLNHDGVSDAGELKSLADLGIASINLGAAGSNGYIDGQAVLAEGSFTYADGSTGSFVEVDFDAALGNTEAANDDEYDDGLDAEHEADNRTTANNAAALAASVGFGVATAAASAVAADPLHLDDASACA